MFLHGISQNFEEGQAPHLTLNCFWLVREESDAQLKGGKALHHVIPSRTNLSNPSDDVANRHTPYRGLGEAG